MADPSAVVRAAIFDAAKDFTVRIVELGFTRTKRMLWVRRHQHTADFIILSRDGSTYGKPSNYSVSLSVGLGIRVLSDPFVALSPNGRHFDFSERLRAARYHFRFN